MQKSRIVVITSLALLAVGVGCGGSYPAPSERLTTSQAAVRGAEEVGVANEPSAALHLKLAQEQIAQAKTLIQEGDNKRADYVLMRATTEAELALSLSRATTARAEAAQLIEQTNKMRQTAAPQ